MTEQPLGFKIVLRGEIAVLVEDSLNRNGEHGCRPASDPEIKLWQALKGPILPDDDDVCVTS